MQARLTLKSAVEDGACAEFELAGIVHYFWSRVSAKSWKNNICNLSFKPLIVFIAFGVPADHSELVWRPPGPAASNPTSPPASNTPKITGPKKTPASGPLRDCRLGFSLSGRSGDKEQWGGVKAACWHNGWSEPVIHPATGRVWGRGAAQATVRANTEAKCALEAYSRATVADSPPQTPPAWAGVSRARAYASSHPANPRTFGLAQPPSSLGC